MEVGVSSQETAVSLLPSTDAKSQAVQTALEVQKAQLENTTVNVDQESLESSTQPNTDRIPPSGLFFPLVSSIDAEFQATRTASESQKTRPMDTDDSIVAGQHTSPPSPKQVPGMLQGISEGRLSTETAADDLTSSRFSPFVNMKTHQLSFSIQPSEYVGNGLSAQARDQECHSPDSEYSPGDYLAGRPVYIPTRTQYLPQVIDVNRGTCYDEIGADPRLAFRGAPSTNVNSGVSHFLRRTKRCAITNERRRIRTYFPEDCACMIKKEEATLSNGTTYKLTTIWVKEPSESIGVPDQQQPL